MKQYVLIQVSRTTSMFVFLQVERWGKAELDEVDIPVLDLLFECAKILGNVYLIKLNLISVVLFLNSGRNFPLLEKSGGLPSW